MDTTETMKDVLSKLAHPSVLLALQMAENAKTIKDDTAIFLGNRARWGLRRIVGDLLKDVAEGGPHTWIPGGERGRGDLRVLGESLIALSSEKGPRESFNDWNAYRESYAPALRFLYNAVLANRATLFHEAPVETILETLKKLQSSMLYLGL